MNEIFFGDEARQRIKKGIDNLADTIKVTLGPKGKTVIFRQGDIVFSLDGVTIAKNIDLGSKTPEAYGCELVRDIAHRTDKEAGDGTTTATLLTQVIYREGLKAMVAGIDTLAIKKGIQEGAKIAVDCVKKIAKEVKTKEDMKNVATVSSRDPAIGEMIASIFNEVGKEAIVTVEESNIMGLHSEIVEGLQFDRGFISPYFITNMEKEEAILKDAYVLVTTQTVKTNSEILRLLEKIARTDSKSLLLIADDVAGEALATLVINKMRGVLNIVAVKAPGFGDDKREQMEDIAILTGGQLISEELGKQIDDVEIEDLGKARQITILKDSTLIIGGDGKVAAIKKRVGQLANTVKKKESEYLTELAQRRLAKLKGGVAILKIGSISEQETKEKRYRIEDAVRAVKSALEEGIVIGAGMALYNASAEVEKRMEKEKELGIRIGLQILAEAIKEPARQIILNTGAKPDIILDKVGELTGYNSATGEYVDLLKDGIIDPAKVVRVSLENAVSITSMLMSNEVVVSEKEEKK